MRYLAYQGHFRVKSAHDGGVDLAHVVGGQGQGAVGGGVRRGQEESKLEAAGRRLGDPCARAIIGFAMVCRGSGMGVFANAQPGRYNARFCRKSVRQNVFRKRISLCTRS